MNPAKNLRFVAILAIALIAGCRSETGSDASQTPEPAGSTVSNLVLICIDTVRFDTWWTPERAGRTDAFSPWAARGQVMAHALSAAPWTVPSVATVLTGLYPSQHGGGLFGKEVANLDVDVPSALSRSVPTLGEMLDRAGFTTAAVSAHPWFGAQYGLERGFEPVKMASGGDAVTARGLEWLDGHAEDGRFALYLHYMDAHDPHLDLPGSRETVTAMDAGFRDMLLRTAPAPACDDPESATCTRFLSYAAATLELRTHIANVLDALESRGLLAGTLVVVYSDHGEEFHDHLEISAARDEDPRGIHGFGHGQSLYQELLHVPLMIWHPELDGREVGQPVSLVDVLPSIVDWMGLTLPDNIDFPGRSFAAVVENAETTGFEWSPDQRRWPETGNRRLFASGIAYGPEQMAVVDGSSKLIWRQNDNTREYYDLAADPLENDPDLLQVPETVADRLDGALDVYFGWFGAQDYLPPEMTDEVVERLKGVGYLQGVESKRGDDGAEPRDEDG